MFAPGTETEPVSLADVSLQRPVDLTGKAAVPAVSVGMGELVHVDGRTAFDAVIVQWPKPVSRVITTLPFVTSTAVWLVAVKVQAELALTDTTVPKLDEQFENVGGAGVEPVGAVVKASSLPADRTPEWKVQLTFSPVCCPSSVSAPCAVSVVFAGSQLAAEAEPGR